ncbi:MAG TPA: molybdopterin-dependent oxidoreductase [Terriglobales bacterium]|nr:molybdopterin-dependent oxidoreductase [Terriglobales bacterium]
MKSVVHAACPHDCPDACGVRITVQDGRATRIQGDPNHPVTQGFLCAKVAKYLDRVYSPDRVLFPLRRRKHVAKGSGHKNFEDFERISWDEALSEIAVRLRSIARDHGPEAILPYSYGGTLGTLGGGSMDRRFFHRLGASQLDRTICSTAGGDALVSVLGKKLGTEPEQFVHSRYIIAWGANIHGNNVHLWPFIHKARRAGAKLVVIDPYRTRTADCADWYLPITPGTDVALALAMMHIIIGENLYDGDYVARHTTGFEGLRERVKDYPPERVAEWTGITASDIYKLAREYASVRPAVIRLNYGVSRSENGGMAVRAVAMLPCLTGSWKEVGGGLQLSTSGAFPLNKGALERLDLMEKSPLGRRARMVNMTELGKALATLSDPPVKALFVYNSNPAAVAPNRNLVIEQLRRTDLFTIVHEQFLTDTTDYADLVLPATTFFEHKDLQGAYGHHYVQISNQAIAPLGECRSNVDLFRELAARMGFEDDCFRESVDEMIDAALSTSHPWLRGIDRARLEREHFVRLEFNGSSEPSGNGGSEKSHAHFLPFAEGGFFTPSGKAELSSPQLAAQGLDPVACFIPPNESRHHRNGAGGRNSQFPLELLARKADNFLNTTFNNLPTVRTLEEPGLLEIHPFDARSRDIHDGEQVRVFNHRGEIRLVARITDAIQPSVVAARLDSGKQRADGININVLTSDRLTDIGRGATFYSTLVEVKPVGRGEQRVSRQAKPPA